MEAQEVNQAAQAAEAPQAQAPEATQSQPQVTELDALSEFTFQGQKYTPEQFFKIFNEHKTYAEQVKEYESEKKFSDNLQIDLDNVLENPALARQFKATYPKKYHAILDRYLQSGGQSPAQPNPAQPSLPKEFMDDFHAMKERLAFHEKRAYEAEVASANAKLDAMLPPLFKKYEMANEKEVYGRAEAMLASGQNLTEKTWERLVRESHESMQKKADQVYAAKLKTQIEKGQRGADGGPGGAAPGQAPQRPKTLEEAREAMIASLSRQKGA